MRDTADTPAIRTACPYCGVGCGVLATRSNGQVEIAGDPEHPANAGRLCVKGTMLGETVGLEDRLSHPEIDGRQASWDVAIETVADAFASSIRDHGPDSVALYVSGQLLTEDYYVANKLMKGFVGSANIDTNSRLCMASSVAGHKRAFGADIVPGVYEDFDQADLIVLVGSNLAWCHPVLFQRIAALKTARPALQVVNIDPRRTATSQIADMHLGLKPGADVALFNGLLSWLNAYNLRDADYVARHTTGVGEALAAAGPLDLEAISKATELPREILARFYDAWGRAPRVVTIYSQGVNQWSTGTDKVNAILNCHLFTGRIGRPGAGPFSVTGQPNAMGGREVGGLANMLAAHMALENQSHRETVQRFWSAPRMAASSGLKAVEMFEALGDGRIKALWVMATNPAVSLPDADRVASAIAHSGGFVAVSDIVRRTDTTELADVLLPATGWGEKDGTVTNSERRISRQRPFLDAPGEARHDWRIICDVARAIGRRLGEDWSPAFAFETPAKIFREHAALSGFENAGARGFDISAHASIADADFETMQPFQWPAPAGAADAKQPQRFFSEGGFFTPDRRARLLPLSPRETGTPLDDAYPFVLNTGRVRDHWHTMTRTAKSARLSKHVAEPYVELHPQDADDLGLLDAELARLTSRHGEVIARVRRTDRQRRGSVFVPMHWSSQTASQGRVDALVQPLTDPVSGQPESKRTPVRVSRFAAKWHAFALFTREPEFDCAYWALARTERGWRAEMADDRKLSNPEDLARAVLGGDPSDLLSVNDAAKGTYRFALFDGDRLEGVLYLGPGPIALARDWLAAQFDDGKPQSNLRSALLAGRAGSGHAQQGRTVCICENVGADAITRAISSGADTLDKIGSACRAGTNCGSCRTDLLEMLAQNAPAQPAVAAE
ncbi:MAG: molybdopterin-dependent oxidoreductase [Pseudomonadota bacterium]